MPAPTLTGPWHTLDTPEVLERLGVAPESGLATAALAERQRSHGPNVLPEARQHSTWRLVVGQFADLMVLVLIAAAVVAGMVGEPQDSVAIVAIVVLNAALGVVQEYRAERAVAQLRALAAPTARVRRNGQVVVVPADSLVPGDIVLLEAGDIVPADLRLLDVHSLQVNEASLTGESVAVAKVTDPVGDTTAPLGDRRNMAYRGTQVLYGRGSAVVVATGSATELGQVASLLEGAADTRTPLQRRLKRFAAQLAVGVLAICVAVFAIGVLRGAPIMLSFLTALSLAVAAMPEALPAVVTVALALGARRMVQHQALVRRLPAVETLGSVTWICSDKTGTLTSNRLAVTQARRPGGWIAHAEVVDPPLLRAMVLDSDAIIGADGTVAGESTESALLEHAITHADAAVIRAAFPRIDELPFSSERRRMTTLHRDGDGGGHLLLMKGAPERVLAHCTQEGDGQPMDRDRALAVAEEMAQGGLRVMAFASRALDDGAPSRLAEEDEWGFTLLGLVGLRDTIRPEAASAVAECRRAGIHVVMVTGDHPETADAVARELGLGSEPNPPVTGAMIEAMDDAELGARVADVRVFARVAPGHKLRIVRALQARGEFVAMTGDGVNDAPALKQADIGVAMGRVGTDVAREAADLVLLEDNFASIVAAVREGRRIYDNIRRFIRYVLTGNSAEIWLLFLAPLVGLPFPLLPIHILWVNLVTDGLPGLALAVEPAEPAVMGRPPRPPGESVFAHGVWQHALWVGLLMGGVCLFTLAWALHIGSPHWQGMTFTVLALSQLGHVLVVRSERESLFTLGLWSNRPLTLVVAGSVVLQLLVLYVPVFNRVLGTQPLTAGELMACVGLSLVVLVAVEFEKWLLRRGWSYGSKADGAQAGPSERQRPGAAPA